MIIILDITLNTISFIDIDIRIWQFFDNTTIFGFFFWGREYLLTNALYIMYLYQIHSNNNTCTKIKQ